MNASTFTVRVIASTGADVAAALSARRRRALGPAARRRAEPRAEDARRRRARGRRRALRQGAARPRRAADGLRPPRVPRRGPARPGAAPHEQGDRLAPLRRSPRRSSGRRSPSSQARRPDRVLATNVEFWSAVVLDHADVPAELFTSMFTCARTAGWSAHILEQKREGRLIRPTAKYVGPPPRSLAELAAERRGAAARLRRAAARAAAPPQSCRGRGRGRRRRVCPRISPARVRGGVHVRVRDAGLHRAHESSNSVAARRPGPPGPTDVRGGQRAAHRAGRGRARRRRRHRARVRRAVAQPDGDAGRSRPPGRCGCAPGGPRRPRARQAQLVADLVLAHARLERPVPVGDERRDLLEAAERRSPACRDRRRRRLPSTPTAPIAATPTAAFTRNLRIPDLLRSRVAP